MVPRPSSVRCSAATVVDNKLSGDRSWSLGINWQGLTLVYIVQPITEGWLGSRVVSVLDSGAEGLGFKSQPRRCRVTVLGKLFTPIVPLFTKQQNW